MGPIVLVFFLLAAGVGVGIVSKNAAELHETSVFKDRSDSAKVALTGLSVAKSALTRDDVWNDCDGAERNCADGYFPLYSYALDADMENYSVDNARLDVLIKPVNSKTVNVISVGNLNGKKVYFASKFQKITSTDKVPLVYGGSSHVYGGTVCSYFWDDYENKVTGVTLPNFTVYLNDNFYWSPNIYVPRRPAGENPKDVRFATNYSTRVSGYRVIDKLYSTGDVRLENGAYIDYVYANGNVYTDGSSSYGKKVENGNYTFPNFKTALQDNSISFNARKKIYCFSGRKYLAPGRYDSVVVGGNCELILTGQNYKIEKFYVTGIGEVRFSDPDTQLIVEDMSVYVNGGITYKSENGRESFITIKANNINVGVSSGWGGWFGKSSIVCSDPLTCLIDTNNISTRSGSFVQATILARNQAYFNGGTIVGNIFGENVDARYATICNVVDSEGSQLIARGYFDIVDPDGSQFPAVIEEVKRVVCNDIDDCDAKLQ